MFGDKVWAKVLGTMITMTVLVTALALAFDRALTIAGYPA